MFSFLTSGAKKLLEAVVEGRNCPRCGQKLLNCISRDKSKSTKDYQKIYKNHIEEICTCSNKLCNNHHKTTYLNITGGETCASPIGHHFVSANYKGNWFCPYVGCVKYDAACDIEWRTTLLWSILGTAYVYTGCCPLCDESLEVVTYIVKGKEKRSICFWAEVY